jgi:hypothetical protein
MIFYTWMALGSLLSAYLLISGFAELNRNRRRRKAWWRS